MLSMYMRWKVQYKLYSSPELTLSYITLSLDESIFAKGQAYVAMSWVPNLNKLNVFSY